MSLDRQKVAWRHLTDIKEYFGDGDVEWLWTDGSLFKAHVAIRSVERYVRQLEAALAEARDREATK